MKKVLIGLFIVVIALISINSCSDAKEEIRTFDFGYTRSVQRPDGKIVTIYYYTTEENHEQYIAATIWDPDDIQKCIGTI